MGLAQWLATSEQRFGLSLDIAAFLMQEGYHPVMTAPAGRSDQPRRDHTVAIIEQLLDWKEPLTGLRVFSWGPVFRAYKGTWEDALDVELLEFSESAANQDIYQLVCRLMERFPLPGPTRMVLSHAGLTRDVLAHYGVSEPDQATFSELLRIGNPLAAETRLQQLDRRLPEVFQPLPGATFRDALCRILGADWLTRPELAALAAWEQGPWSSSRIDLSLTGAFDYYHGVVFHLYTEGWGQECIAGGQYRCAMNGHPAPVSGIGFVIKPEVWPGPDAGH